MKWIMICKASSNCAYLSCQYIVPKNAQKAKYTHNIPKYEMTRLDRMKYNQERIDALGLEHLSKSLKDSTQLNCANEKRNRASVMVDDDDYVPPIGDDDNDDESSNSLIHKVLYM